MDALILENQAWVLRCRLQTLVDAEHQGYAVRYSTFNMRQKLRRVSKRAFYRAVRRIEKRLEV